MTAHRRGIPPPLSPSDRSGGLIDNHGRRITYLRLAITDRCNLRCRYCMPEGGVDFVPHAEILTFEEHERLVRLLAAMGVSKIRITGGEPFVRRGCLPFLQRLAAIDAISSLHVTTNGVETSRFLGELEDLGIAGVNLSLDTLDRRRFWQITRQDHFAQVMATLDGCLARRLPLKINSVVMPDTSDREILGLADLARKHPVSVRFIELMPFSGNAGQTPAAMPLLRERLHGLFPAMALVHSDIPTTARVYAIPGFSGTIGLIEGNSRCFCATCNKIRITPVGMLKTCLYDNGVLDLKEMLRCGATDHEIQQAIRGCVSNRFVNGHAAQTGCQRRITQSMAAIGG